jgi:hypothetical protein
MNTDLPLTAPRGKRFAIVRQSHVIASPAHPIRDVIRASEFELREQVDMVAASIDWRLNPAVILIDKERP